MIPITIEIDQDGLVNCIYTDDIDLFTIGPIINIKKVSDVEFNIETQMWEVLVDEKVIYKNTNRQKAIEWEIETFSPKGV